MNVTVTISDAGAPLAPGARVEVTVDVDDGEDLASALRNVVDAAMTMSLGKIDANSQIEEMFGSIPRVALDRLSVLETWLAEDGGPMFEDPREVYGPIREFFTDMRAVLGLRDDESFSVDGEGCEPIFAQVAARTQAEIERLRADLANRLEVIVELRKEQASA